MSSDNGQKGFSRSTIILLGIILVLFIMYMNQSQVNKQAEQVFAEQTIRAEYQKSVSLTATKQMEIKVGDCIDPPEGYNPWLSTHCVIGVVYDVQEIEKADINEPQSYATYFRPAPNTFFLYGIYDTRSYIGKCVKVSGEITFTPENTPAMYVEEYGDNIEELPDNMCRP